MSSSADTLNRSRSSLDNQNVGNFYKGVVLVLKAPNIGSPS